MLQVVEDEPFGLAHRMATREPLVCRGALKVTINMVHHLVNSGVSPRPVLISPSIISDADNTLSLLTYEGERIFKKRLLF